MYKLLGIVFIVVSCTSIGFLYSTNQRKETQSLHELIRILKYMECLLQYQMLPLVDVFQEIVKKFPGFAHDLFDYLSKEMENQVLPDASSCMQVSLSQTGCIPKLTYQALQKLGENLGQFDLDGQLKGIVSVRKGCEETLHKFTMNQEERLRTYKTMALCAGAAIAILLV